MRQAGLSSFLQPNALLLPPHGLLHQELIVDHGLESLPVKFLKVVITLQKTVLTLPWSPWHLFTLLSQFKIRRNYLKRVDALGAGDHLGE